MKTGMRTALYFIQISKYGIAAAQIAAERAPYFEDGRPSLAQREWREQQLRKFGNWYPSGFAKDRGPRGEEFRPCVRINRPPRAIDTDASLGFT